MYGIVCLCDVFVHSRFIENPLINPGVTNPSFLRWFCHNGASPISAFRIKGDECYHGVSLFHISLQCTIQVRVEQWRHPILPYFFHFFPFLGVPV
jgi:hypothetical protein